MLLPLNKLIYYGTVYIAIQINLKLTKLYQRRKPRIITYEFFNFNYPSIIFYDALQIPQSNILSFR